MICTYILDYNSTRENLIKYNYDLIQRFGLVQMPTEIKTNNLISMLISTNDRIVITAYL